MVATLTAVAAVANRTINPEKEDGCWLANRCAMYRLVFNRINKDVKKTFLSCLNVSWFQ